MRVLIFLPSREVHRMKSLNNTIITNISNTGFAFLLHLFKRPQIIFDESLAIGMDGFGKIYRGFLADGTKVAMKRGHTQSQQGQTLF
ncbi:hypothetical protein RDABS01_024247 [Bienertia sinuspersici]